MSRMIDNEEELKDYGLIEIDGVNVAECEFLLSNYECMSNYEMIDCGGEISQFYKCKDCPDCYFKQLQRAKAENKRLSELTCPNCGEKFLSPTGCELYEEIVQLKARLEQYKKSKQASYESMQKEWNKAVNELRELKVFDKIEFKQYYKAENERLKAENEELVAQLSRFYRKKEYIRLLKYKQALEEVEKYCNECNLKADYTACEVLKIINEVQDAKTRI